MHPAPLQLPLAGRHAAAALQGPACGNGATHRQLIRPASAKGHGGWQMNCVYFSLTMRNHAQQEGNLNQGDAENTHTHTHTVHLPKQERCQADAAAWVMGSENSKSCCPLLALGTQWLATALLPPHLSSGWSSPTSITSRSAAAKHLARSPAPCSRLHTTRRAEAVHQRTPYMQEYTQDSQQHTCSNAFVKISWLPMFH